MRHGNKWGKCDVRRPNDYVELQLSGEVVGWPGKVISDEVCKKAKLRELGFRLYL